MPPECQQARRYIAPADDSGEIYENPLGAKIFIHDLLLHYEDGGGTGGRGV